MLKLQFSGRRVKPLSFLPPQSKTISDTVNWGQEDSREDISTQPLSIDKDCIETRYWNLIILMCTV